MNWIYFAQQSAPAGSGGFPLIMMLLLFAGMWFLLIAPQRKKQKEHQKMIESLVKGEKVITAGGIYGEITQVKDDRFVIQVAEQTKIEVQKNFVSTHVSGETNKS